MSFDLDELRAVSERPQPPVGGVAGLVYHLQRREDMRDWITLETVALPPVPREGGDALTALVTVAAKRTPEQVQYEPAWGWATWSWPELKLVDRQRFDELPTEDPRSDRIAGFRRPGPGWIAPSAPAAAAALRRLLERLEAELGDRWPPARPVLDALADDYRQVVPPDGLRLYRVLAPELADWLGDRPRGLATPRDPNGRS